MTYQDEIVDEVRAIREQICLKAGSLENLLATLRVGEEEHPGRMAKRVAGTEYDQFRDKVNVSGKALCAEPEEKYQAKKRRAVNKPA